MTLRHKRNMKKVQIAQRRQTVIQMITQGRTQLEIASELGVAQGTVSADLKAALKEYRETLAVPIEDVFTAEMLKLEQLEREIWSVYRTLPAHKKDPRLFHLLLNVSIQRQKILGLTDSGRSFDLLNNSCTKDISEESVSIMARALEAAGLVVPALDCKDNDVIDI